MDYTLDAVNEVSKQIVRNISSKVILLYGDMGAGKTTLIKSLVKCLGSVDRVSSPTFSIVNEYRTADDIIYHFDLYRIKDLEEACNFGIEEYLYSNHWVLIEWPERIESILPKDFDRIDLEINENGTRSVKLNFETNFVKQIC